VKIPTKNFELATTQTTRFYGVMTRHETQPKECDCWQTGFPPFPPKNDVLRGVSPEGRWYCGCHTSIDRAKLLPSPNLKFQEIHPTNPGRLGSRPMRVGILKEW